MNYEYIRIDMMTLLDFSVDYNKLKGMPDLECREDYQCFFVLKGSRTHTWLALNYPDVFEHNPY